MPPLRITFTNLRSSIAAVAVGAVFGVAPLLAGSPAAAQADTRYRSNFDIFAGTDKPGPYTLSWTNLRVSRDEPIAVVVDGFDVKSDAFTIDPIKGH